MATAIPMRGPMAREMKVTNEPELGQMRENWASALPVASTPTMASRNTSGTEAPATPAMSAASPLPRSQMDSTQGENLDRGADAVNRLAYPRPDADCTT